MKNDRLELTLSPDYMGNWGTWEAVREILQNGLDREGWFERHKTDMSPRLADAFEDQIIRLSELWGVK